MLVFSNLRRAALGAGCAVLLATAADAAVDIYVYQSGADVVASASGSLPGVTTGSACCGSTEIYTNPYFAQLGFGSTGQPLTIYSITGPGSFGSVNNVTDVSSSSGTTFILNGHGGQLFLPPYYSGSSLAATDTFANQTLASLGFTMGTYLYTVGSDTLTVYVGTAPPAVPEPATWAMMLLGFGAIGFAMRRRNGAIPQLA